MFTTAALGMLGMSAMMPRGRFWAAPAAPCRLLLIFLRGGYDAANLLVPVASADYYEARPHIAIAPPSADPGSALPLTPDWGLHPALRDSLLPAWQRREFALLPFAGTDDISRSHFETQDTIELGQPPGAGRDFQSGFLNRLVAELDGAQPLAFTAQLPLACRGHAEFPNVDLGSLGKPALDPRQAALVASMYQDTTLGGAVNDGFDLRAELLQELAGEMAAAGRHAVNARGFAAQAGYMATLLRGGHNLGFVDIGGWDTHVGEGGSSGYLAGRLGELGRGLQALAAGLRDTWRDTVVVVISEFGRTFRENGNRGTDHGHGSVYWFLGGAVRGGRVLGDRHHVDRASLFQDRDFPVDHEYRRILAGLFGRLYGLDRDRLARVFPGTTALDMGIL